MDCIAELLEDSCSDIDCSDGDDSYIEIALDTAPRCYNDEEEDKSNLKGSCIDDGCEEYQLRISISPTIPVSLEDIQDSLSLDLETTVPRVASIGAPCISSNLMSFSTDTRTCADSQAIMPMQHSSVSQTDEPAVEFAAHNQLLFNTVSFNPRVLWESGQPDGPTSMQRATPVIPYNNVDLLYARKQPSMTTTTTTTNGGMMKLLIKFRGIKIGALLASLVKPQPCQANNGHKSSKKSKRFFQCYQKRLVIPSNVRCTVNRDQGRRSKHWDLEDGRISDSFRSSKKSSRVLEMDFGALRGIFNAVGMSIAQKDSRSKKRTWSSPCNTSPIHEGFSLCSSDNSIQAAIAYCKNSFGQTSDFSFCSSISPNPI